MRQLIAAEFMTIDGVIQNEALDERIDESERVVFADLILDAFGKQ